MPSATKVPSFTKGERITPLDGVRGIAILLVLLWHCYACVERSAWIESLPLIGKIAGYGWMGVPLFFCLSGFLITRILLNSRGQTGYYQTFYFRRACRILPLYALLLVTYFIAENLLPATRPGHLAELLSTPEPYWPYWLFLQNFSMLSQDSMGGHWLGVTWSLSIEEQFYLILPLAVAFTPPRFLALILIALILSGVTFRYLVINHDVLPYLANFLLLPGRIDAFASGGLIALIPSCSGAARKSHVIRAMLLIAVLALIFEIGRTQNLFPSIYSSVAYTIISTGFGILIWIAYRAPNTLVSRILSLRPLTYFGSLSYFVYLFHQPANYLAHHFINNSGPHLKDASGITVTLFALTLVISAAALSHRYFESIFIRLGHRSGYSESVKNKEPLIAG